MLPSVVCGGRTCHAGLLDNLTLCSLLMLMLVWALLCLPLLAVEACANRRTLVGPCSTAPWWSSVCAYLPHSVLLMSRPSPGLPTVGRLTALIMLLYQAPGIVAPGSLVATCLPLGRLVVLPSLVQCMLLTPQVIGRTAFLWRYVPLWSSGGRHAAPSGEWRALTVPPSRTLRVVVSSSPLRAIQPPPWAIVDEHGRYAAGAVCRAAKAAFGAPARHPRREHIDCAAWALICDRRIVKTWCRERRVSAATRGIAPGRTPDPL